MENIQHQLPSLTKYATPGEIRAYCIATKQHLLDLKLDGITTDADIKFGTLLLDSVIQFIDEGGK